MAHRILNAVGRRDDQPTVPLRSATSAAETPFDTHSDRFEIRGELGRGGMGRVDDAFDSALGRPVAIKHMLRDDLPRFAREARITARLEHPGIVPIHEAGRTRDGTPFYVMRRVDGRPLSELVAGASVADRLALIPNVLAACDAVAFAHARGIIHRDIKPTNILVGPFGETLVIDWGLARELDSDAPDAEVPASDVRTRAGAISGTPGFMAPEQARGERVDTRADVYSLGATLFHTLAAQTPHDASRATDLLVHASLDHAPDWTALPAGVTPDLRAILAKALASDPAERYRNAGELAADLRRFVTGNLVAAHHYGVGARVARFARRHRAALAVAAAGAIALAIVGIVSVRRVVAERDHANDARTVAVDTADKLLVQQAEQLAATDPVGAIVLLRRLPAESAHWREAWLAATAAWTRGIPFGFHSPSRVSSVQLSADGHRVIIASVDGPITVYDLADRTRRIVATIPRARRCHWISEVRAVCAHDGHASIVDTENATAHELAERIATIIGDRRTRALAETSDHRVIEIAGDGTTRTLAEDAELAAASSDVDRFVVWHRDELEVHDGGHVLALASFPDSRRRGRGAEIRDREVVALVGGDVYRWRLDDDRATDTGHWPKEGASTLLLASGHVYGFGGRFGTPELRTIDSPGGTSVVQPVWVVPTAHGMIAAEASGTLAIRDDNGWFRLGPYPMTVAQVDVSPGGHELVAVSDRDDVLVWDLAAIRPRTIAIADTEEPVRLTPRHLWTIDKIYGLTRRALPAGVPDVLLRGYELGTWFYVPPDGSWAALQERPTGPLSVFDAARSRVGGFPGIAAEGPDADGIVMAGRDGVVKKWAPGVDDARAIGRLPFRPDGLAVRGGFALATQGATLSRFELATGHRDVAAIADVRRFTILPSGRAWVVAGAGELWRWDVAMPAIRVDVGEPVDDVGAVEDHVFAHAARSMFALDADPPRAIATESWWWSWMGDGYLATVSAHGEISVVDSEMASHVTLQPRTVPPTMAIRSPLVSRGDTLVFVAQAGQAARVHLLELAVPHEPAALARWLSEITNAEPAAGGRSAQWK
jgi:WD40 repeat protein